MLVKRLDGSGLRNLQPFSLQPDRLNILVGENGSGKSSVLEALHLLATGRSFRDGRLDGAIRHGQDTMTLFALGEDQEGRQHRIGYRKGRHGDSEIRLDGETSSLGEAAGLLPVRFVGPGSEALLEGEPAGRRALLDWILFHVEPGYLQLWRRANKALSQRNALLRQRAAPATLRTWSRELADATLRIRALRQQALSDLFSRAILLLPRFAFMEGVELNYAGPTIPETDQDWSELELRERELGYSLVGFQRDDLRIRVAQGLARDVLSRGQKKALVYVLLLAEAALVRSKTGKISVLLLDDLCSELDQKNAGQVLRLILETGMQAFMSVLDTHELDALLPAEAPRRMFHVEHGSVSLKG